jgi:hypothetical protein
MIRSDALSPREREALLIATGSRQLPPEVEPFDLNLAEPELLLNLGLAPGEVARIRSLRPFFALDELAEALPLAAGSLDTLRRVFTVSPLRYVDPVTGQWCELRADAGEWVVEEPVASGTDTLAKAAATPRGPRLVRQGQRPQRTDAEASGPRPFPSFLDRQGRRRHLHPEFVQVQARCATDDPALVALLQALGLRVHQTFAHRGLFTARLGDGRHGLAALSGALLALHAAPCIEVAEPAWLGFDDLGSSRCLEGPDFGVAGTAVPPADAIGAPEADAEAGPRLPWNLAMLQAPAFWEESRGNAAVILACVDSGVDLDHPSLAAPDPAAGRSLANFTDEAPVDELGHGTSVAGLLVGNGQLGVWGLAPNCSLLALKVALWANPGSYASRRAALMSLLPMARAGQRLVVNLSWRTAGDVALIRLAIGELAAAGALIVCSSGNEGQQGDVAHFPSDYPQTVSVGAVAQDGRRAAYSNVSPQVDLMAPGGTDGAPLRCSSPGAQAVSRTGTSFAAPQVAAAAALAWGLRLELSAPELRALLERSSRELAGHRIPDLAELLQRLRSAVGGPAPPAPPPPPAGGLSPFPMAGAELLQRCSACGIQPITARILLVRPALADWGEVEALLGMNAAILSRMRSTIDAGGS